MSVFHFKRFDVVNERSAMKVNTDGVLLGALAEISCDDRAVLDIGTGTGTIALMLAQRLNDLHGDIAGAAASAPGQPLRIDAVEIDGDSAREARMNFAASPWADCLHLHHCPLSEWENRFRTPEASDSGERDAGSARKLFSGYDLIVSNPPFFEETLHSPDERKARARHSDSLSWREIIDFAAKALKPVLRPDGDFPEDMTYRTEESGNHAAPRLCLILPAGQETELRRYAAEKGLFAGRIVSIRSTDRKPFTRIITTISRCRPQNLQRETLTIHNGTHYSEEYLCAIRDFLLFA